jgi:type I restriction enzyme, S subunit
MTWSFVELKTVTENLDNKRKPLNDIERQNISLLGLYPYIGANNIMGFVDEYLFDGEILCIAEDGGNWGAQSVCAKIFNEKCWVNNHAHVLRANGKLHLPFLMYYLNYQDLSKYVTGSTRGKLTKSALDSIPIPLPPLPVQKRIAEILDAADTLRKKDQELLKKYDELAQAIFIDMFGDPVKNEKGWEVKRLAELGTLDRGVSKHRPRNAPELLGGKYPLIQTGDVANSGGVINSYRSTYSELGLKQSKMWTKGTLCITIAANIAKTGILDFDACFPDSIVGFTPNSKKTNSIYVQYWFGFLQKTLENNAPESAQKNINLEILRELQIPCPALALQEKFKEVITNLVNMRDRIDYNVPQYLFDSILHKSFSGELVS